ncbi:TPA: hypothetical protein ACHYWH_005326, partial [Escherichia coli]
FREADWIASPPLFTKLQVWGTRTLVFTEKITISEMSVESRYADIVKRIHKIMPVNTFVILNEIFIQK